MLWAQRRAPDDVRSTKPVERSHLRATAHILLRLLSFLSNVSTCFIWIKCLTYFKKTVSRYWASYLSPPWTAASCFMRSPGNSNRADSAFESLLPLQGWLDPVSAGPIGEHRVIHRRLYLHEAHQHLIFAWSKIENWFSLLVNLLTLLHAARIATRFVFYLHFLCLFIY